MAKVATRGPLPSNPIHFGGGVGGGNACSSKVMTAAKRKTPSELRGEQLKRKKIVELVDESLEPALGSLQNTNGGSCGLKKPDSSKNPRYIDTRMDELFPVRKNSIRLRLLSRKENAEVNIPVKQTVSMKSSFVNSELDYKRRPPISWIKLLRDWQPVNLLLFQLHRLSLFKEIMILCQQNFALNSIFLAKGLHLILH